MRGKNDARIHTGRHDSNRRPGGTRRRRALDWAANEETASRARAHKRQAKATWDPGGSWHEEPETAEAWNESVDGLHPFET